MFCVLICTNATSLFISFLFQVALGADRVIGIYPETKHPMWHNSLDITEGTTFEDILVELLSKYCYGGDITSDTWAAQPIFIQSFEVGNLKYLSGRRIKVLYVI